MDAQKIKEIIGSAAPQEIVRGWEITRGNGYPTGMRYAPSFLGACQCATDVKWLQERHPTKNYEMRALVSVARPVPPEVIEADTDAPSNQATDEGCSAGMDPMIAAALEADAQETDAG